MPCKHPIASRSGKCFLCPPRLLPPGPTPVRGQARAEIRRLQALRRKIRIKQSRASLAEFLKNGWHVLEPNTKLDWGWHIQALCDHVQALIEDQWRAQDDPTYEPRAQNLAINVPPGTLKSRILSVYAPAWAWIHRPSWRLLALSSNPIVADRDADYSKQIVESTWYRNWFIKPLPDHKQWEIRRERDAIRNYHNTAGGYRISRGLNATVTGLRGDAIFIDDPNDVKLISDVQLDAVRRNWRAASNRVNDERIAVRVLIQQRTHERDLTGSLFDQGAEEAEGVDWEHLVIAMEREIGEDGNPIECVACKTIHRKSFLGWTDPRNDNGMVLQPERNTPKVLKAAQRKLGSMGYAGQMQQRPSPIGGGMFKKSYWRSYDELETNKLGIPKLDTCVISVDANFKEGGTSRAAIVVVLGYGPKRFILHAWADSVDYPTLKKQLKRVIDKFPYYSKILIEDKANGSALIAELSKTHHGVVGTNPMGGKVSRANAILPDVEAGDVFLPRNAAWRDEFISEHASFPAGRYDDFVDALSQALADMLELSDVERARAMGTM